MRKSPDQVEVPIRSRDYWFKGLENHQTNWCLIDAGADRSVIAYFFHELSGVFDRLKFETAAQADAELRFNGFVRLAECPDLDQSSAPLPPFRTDRHPNGPIYSSGRFWRKPSHGSTD